MVPHVDLRFVWAVKALPKPVTESLYEAELVNAVLLRAYPRTSPEVSGLVEAKVVVSKGLDGENLLPDLGASAPCDSGVFSGIFPGVSPGSSTALLVQEVLMDSLRHFAKSSTDSRVDDVEMDVLVFWIHDDTTTPDDSHPLHLYFFLHLHKP